MSSYLWSISGGTITSPTTTAQSVTYTAGAIGTLTLTLNVTNSSGCSATNSTNVTVTAPATAPTITIANAVAKAPARGATATLPFKVTLSAPSAQTVTVGYYTSNQTAIAGTDYVAANSTLTFAPGVTEQYVNITIKGTGATTNKQFLVNLQTPTNATIAIVNGFPSRGTGVIMP
jgi:chitinase